MLPLEKSNNTGGCGVADWFRMLPGMVRPPATIVVSDAHLTPERPEVTDEFHRFLGAIPALGSHLIVNGDLFEFWFEYRSVVHRAAFDTLVALAGLRRAGVALTVLGGNHDRWGGSFWVQEMGADYYADSAELDVTGWRALITHGNGLGGDTLAGRFLNRVVRSPVTIGAFRRIHPDLGLSLATRLSRVLAGRKDDTELIRRSAAAQAQHARQTLQARPDLALMIMGHTHRPALEQTSERQWYLNPGAWVDGYRYAVISGHGPELCAFT